MSNVEPLPDISTLDDPPQLELEEVQQPDEENTNTKLRQVIPCGKREWQATPGLKIQL